MHIIFLGAGLLIFSGAALAQTPQPKSDTGKDPRTALRQEIELPASPQRVYEVLLDSTLFSAFSGEHAEINRGELGGSFSLFGGQVVGRNLELLPGQRVVQAWRLTHWDPGIYSIVRFELKLHGTGTKLILYHTGFPAGEFASLSEGWGKKYWVPLRTYLGPSPRAP